MPGSKSEYSGARRDSRARLTPALTNSSIWAGTRCSRLNSRPDHHLQPPPGEFVFDAEPFDVEIEHALLLVLGRIAHADVSVEAAGAPGSRFVDRFAMIGRGDGDRCRDRTRPPDSTCNSSPVTSSLLAAACFGFWRSGHQIEILQDHHRRGQGLRQW